MNQEKIGKYIASKRKEMGLSQEQLAERLMCSNRSVSRWENGRNLPDYDKWNELEQNLGVSIAQLIQGRTEEENKEQTRLVSTDIEYDFLSNIKTDYISSIHKKGYYDIIDEDLEEFFPVIRYDIAIIMGIALELSEKGYAVKDVFSNGFGIYFSTDDEASEFSTAVFWIIDEYMHHDNTIVVQYASKTKEKIDKMEEGLIEEVEVLLWGKKRDKQYYWTDDKHCVRGYAINEEECKKQAKEQDCAFCNVFKNE